MITDVVSKPVYQILNKITGEPRLEVALPLALKELIRLKLQEATKQRFSFEKRYDMDFTSFKATWLAQGESQDRSYEVEQDMWEWEAAVTDEEQYREMLSKLP
ncbi:MAG: hypothetical protein KDE53_09605 [Caldilineaceae bacterium]|nr:hypothetical protein [Caldilineaceae bacterium]MCB0123986.1 hypothetical protein [Caldilineaceae bacterium]